MAFLRSAATRSLRTVSFNPSVTRSAALKHPQLCTFTRTQALNKVPRTLALTRWASTDRPNVDQIDVKAEEAAHAKRIRATPELVSTHSTQRIYNNEVGERSGKEAAQRGKWDDDETEMLGGVKGDLRTIAETFSMKDVPHQAYVVGMAGVVPYLATSLSTVFCASEINRAAEHGTGWLLDANTAELALHAIEPLQVGYGAVIISFLGAIHWGLEWAAFGGIHGYPRYSIGIISTGLAWPTLLLPVEYALISQFLIFNFLYYTDSRASRRGWAPRWYGVYRFVLTFIVGGSILASLIGRGQIAGKIDKLPSPVDRIRSIRASQGEYMEEEEEARRKFLGSEEEEEEEEEEGGDDEE
ncbi:hypothetical protein LTR78_004209 [Recurvomyces mirabilis]|uniref:Mitochondrial inner membrane protein 1 n=1 Tax=Recurvomyces mirabilis TaxID=574656 RepID=A0AAE1C2Z4_9PEZI|nr:hypothetical protein LTR78_004209 [Recurvomyces mirabilis]KAK5153621.1 hypothetical protein LTS14_007315 [Recurvomyces mirabilis]